ncbi:unnamed protein product, partial [Phaeothamnion confervicola]
LVRSSLSRTIPRPQTPEWELEEFRRRAWQMDGVACIKVDRINDDWERQVIVNVANKLFGERAKT